jgi:hypothetical protein
MTIIWFTRSLPNAVADELKLQGHTVNECLAISEVLALAEEHWDAQVVIAADVDGERARIVAQHYPALRLKPGVTAGDVIFELSHGAAFPLKQ